MRYDVGGQNLYKGGDDDCIPVLRRGVTGETLSAYLEESHLPPAAVEEARVHGGYSRKKDADLERALLDSDGTPLWRAPAIRELLDMMGFFKDFKIPRDISLGDLAGCIGEVHTQAAIYDFHVIMTPASQTAISEARLRPTDRTAPPPLNGIIIDATNDGFLLKANLPEDIDVVYLYEDDEGESN